MKKIIALFTIFVMTFTYGYAGTGDSVNLDNYDLLKTNIFYINGQGYIKENGKLKQIDGVKFYSINGVRYINDNGIVKQIKENKIKRVNGVNYVISGDTLIKLDKYLLENPVKKEKKQFSDIFKLEKKEDLKLDYLHEYKLNTFKEKALENISKAIKEKYPKNISSLELLEKGKFTTKQIEKIRNYYSNLGEIELSKNINVLKNISQIDIKKVNYAIKKKLNNEKINFVDSTDTTKNNEYTINNFNIKKSSIDNTDNNIDNTTKDNTDTISNENNTTKDNTDTISNENNTTKDETVDADLKEIMNFFDGL